ncbi:MAG: ECF transporter S component, partial [Ruminococcus sp.]|nr:ECF transporter S component [Ruminococcus sp.]
MKEKAKISTRSMVLMALLTAIIVVFSCTPIGSIPIGPLVITLNVIPVAIAAIALGPIGGAAMGAVFGLFSILQCVG